MKLYWSYHSIPELRDLPLGERVELRRRAISRIEVRRSLVSGVISPMLLFLATIFVPVLFIVAVIDNFGGGIWIQIFIAVIFSIVWALIFLPLHIAKIRPCIREEREAEEARRESGGEAG